MVIYLGMPREDGQLFGRAKEGDMKMYYFKKKSKDDSDVYLTCCFIQFLFETGVVFVHLLLDFSIGYKEKSKVVLI